MRQLTHYFPFFIITALLYGLFFHYQQQPIVIAPQPLNSGQQSLQLQFIEMTANSTAEIKSKKKETETAKAQEKEQTQQFKSAKTAENKTAGANSKKRSEIKIAKQKLHKAIRENSAESDAMLKAELFAADLKLDAAVLKSPETAQAQPSSTTAKSTAPLAASEQQAILQQQEKAKPVFKKQPATNRSSTQTPGILQEAIVVSGNIPVYPKRAILRNQQGRVVIKLTVTTQGKAKNPQIITSSGHSVLDQAALTFVKQEKFMPAHKGEEKITTEQIFSFRFELK